MKRFYTLVAATLIAAPVAFAQAPDTTFRISTITAPASIARVDTVTGQAGDGSWGVFLPPESGLAGTMVLVDDGLGGREACLPGDIANGPDLAGNIAVISRGTCEFGVKAFNAQGFGAIGFVIYNHDLNATETDETFIFMGGGVNGVNVNIPGMFWARFIRNAVLPTLEAGTPAVEGRIDRACTPGPCTVDIEPGPITESTVYAARPNPFSTTTEFGVQLVRTQHVTIEVFNTVGQRVALLHDGVLSAGANVHEFTLEASALPSGVYLYRVTGEDFIETQSVVLAR